MKTKLYRSRTDSMLGGVCGGLGQYLGIDPILIRLFLVLLTIGGGSGVLIYLVLWIVIPLEGEGAGAITTTLSTGADEMAARAQQLSSELGSAVRSPHPQAALIIGVSLLVLGVIYLLRNLGLPWIGWLDLSTLWPLLLIGGGVALILRRGQGVSL
jgi:phage shock protein C